MKVFFKKKTIIPCVVGVLVILLFVLNFENLFLFVVSRFPDEQAQYSMYTELSDGLFFGRNSSLEQSIFSVYGDVEETDLTEREYIIKDKYIFRFAYDELGYVAYHWNELEFCEDDLTHKQNIRDVNSIKFLIKKDLFTIYDINKKIHHDFTSQTEFLTFCKNNNIHLNWIFPNGHQYISVEKINTRDRWEVLLLNGYKKDAANYGFVLKNDEIIYEGYISELTKTNDNVLTFRLQIPHKSLLEFQNLSYTGLNVSFDDVKGKCTIDKIQIPFFDIPLSYRDIYYDQYISIDTVKNDIQEIR